MNYLSISRLYCLPLFMSIYTFNMQAAIIPTLIQVTNNTNQAIEIQCFEKRSGKKEKGDQAVAPGGVFKQEVKTRKRLNIITLLIKVPRSSMPMAGQNPAQSQHYGIYEYSFLPLVSGYQLTFAQSEDPAIGYLLMDKNKMILQGNYSEKSGK